MIEVSPFLAMLGLSLSQHLSMPSSISDFGLLRSIYDIMIYKLLFKISMYVRKCRKYVRMMLGDGTRKGSI